MHDVPRPPADRLRQWLLRSASAVALAGVGSVGAVLPPAHAVDNLTVSRCQTFEANGSQQQKTWVRDRLDLDQVWKVATGKGVVVAVLDSGTSNVNTPYFNENNVTSLNLLPENQQSQRDGYRCDHGTQVTALIVAGHGPYQSTNFGGVAPDAKVIAYRTLTLEEDKGKPETILGAIAANIKGIDDAIARRARVINISQAVDADPAVPGIVPALKKYKAAIERAQAAGVVVVAAAGNADQGLNGPAFPASWPGVIAVGASLPDDQPSTVNHPATEVTVAAPGAGVLTLLPTLKAKQPDKKNPAVNQAFTKVDGTSFATPLVTGTVALLLEREPKLTPAQVRQRLIETADRPIAAPPAKGVGWGVVNPLRALTGVPVPTAGHPSPTVAITPKPKPVPPPRDPRPARITLAVAGGATVLTLLALVLKLVLPAAQRREFEAAERPKE